MIRTAALSLALCVLGLGCGPMGETPGLRLGGSPASVPENFLFVRDAEVIQLAVPGAILPRVVNIWGVGFANSMYVWGDPGSGWVERVHARPDQVRVRVGVDVYALSATEVTDPAERARVADAYNDKYAEQLREMYGRATTVNDFELFFRLSPRSP